MSGFNSGRRKQRKYLQLSWKPKDKPVKLKQDYYGYGDYGYGCYGDYENCSTYGLDDNVIGGYGTGYGEGYGYGSSEGNGENYGYGYGYGEGYGEGYYDPYGYGEYYYGGYGGYGDYATSAKILMFG